MQTMTPKAFETLNELGDYARRGFADAVRGLPLQVTGAGSLFKVSATDRPVRNYRDAATSDRSWEAACSLALLNEGFMLTPTMSGCISLVSTRTHVDALLAAFRGVIAA
jgi:glutamate-1-semialdehyde aminotransferase